MNHMMCVPENLITGKDLDYLNDMFHWNYISFKKTCNDLEYIHTQEIVDLFGEVCDFFENNLTDILEIINHPGGEDYE